MSRIIHRRVNDRDLIVIPLNPIALLQSVFKDEKVLLRIFADEITLDSDVNYYPNPEEFFRRRGLLDTIDELREELRIKANGLIVDLRSEHPKILVVNNRRSLT